ncbi:unnamed protein product [Sympodiomycopsis kandeliae]
MVVPVRSGRADEDMLNTLFGIAGLDITYAILWHWSHAVYASRFSNHKAIHTSYADARKLLSRGQYPVVEATESGIPGRSKLSGAANPDFVIWTRNDQESSWMHSIIAVGESKPNGTLKDMETLVEPVDDPFGVTEWPIGSEMAVKLRCKHRGHTDKRCSNYSPTLGRALSSSIMDEDFYQ